MPPQGFRAFAAFFFAFYNNLKNQTLLLSKNQTIISDPYLSQISLYRRSHLGESLSP